MTRHHPFDTSKSQYFASIIILGTTAFGSVASSNINFIGKQNFESSKRGTYAFYINSNSLINENKVDNFRKKIRHSTFEPPTDWVYARVDDLKELLDSNNLIIEFISAIPEGGIMIEFFSFCQYHSIEVFNDESIVLLQKHNGVPKAWDLHESSYISKITERISNKVA